MAQHLADLRQRRAGSQHLRRDRVAQAMRAADLLAGWLKDGVSGWHESLVLFALYMAGIVSALVVAYVLKYLKRDRN